MLSPAVPVSCVRVGAAGVAGAVASTTSPVSRPVALAKLVASRLAEGVEVFSSTDTLLLFWLATMMSALPSWFTSAVVTEIDASPTE